MALSRTARFLIAALLVAAAAFVWVNYFNQDPLAPTTATQPGTDTSAPVALADNAGAAQGDAGEAGSAVDESGAAASVGDPVSTSIVAGDAATDAAAAAGPATTPVVTPATDAGSNET